MHPRDMVDFRIRVVIRVDKDAARVNRHVRHLMESVRIDDRDAPHIRVSVPADCEIQCQTIRLKEKKRFLRDHYKASLHRITQICRGFAPPGRFDGMFSHGWLADHLTLSFHVSDGCLRVCVRVCVSVCPSVRVSPVTIVRGK